MFSFSSYNRFNTRIIIADDSGSAIGAISDIFSVDLATNKALISSGSGKVIVSALPASKLLYLTNATSDLQDQIDSISSPTTGDITEVTSAVLDITGGVDSVFGAGVSIEVQQATGGQPGYLSAADWTTFNGKLDTITLTNGNGTTASGSAVNLGGTATVGYTIALGNTISIQSRLSSRLLHAYIDVGNGTSAATEGYIRFQNNSNTTSRAFTLTFDANNELGLGAGAIFRSSGVTVTTLQYAADYSASYTTRSLVDKAYADKKWALSGTSSLTADTTIDGAHTLTFSPDNVVVNSDSVSLTGTDSVLLVDSSGITLTGAAADLILIDGSTGTGTKFKGSIGFFDTAPQSQQPGLTALTHTAPVSPDYALQDLVDVGGFGFKTKDEGNTFISVVKAIHDAMKVYGLLS